MSTPRRPAPRSRAAPMTATFRWGCKDTADKANFQRMGNLDAAAMIRVLLADDDEPFLEALSPLIERQPELAALATGRSKSGRFAAMMTLNGSFDPGRRGPTPAEPASAAIAGMQDATPRSALKPSGRLSDQNFERCRNVDGAPTKRRGLRAAPP